MSDKPRKTAADLKLIIEERLRSGHPEYVALLASRGQPHSSGRDRRSFFRRIDVRSQQGIRHLDLDHKCRRRMESIVAQLRDKFDLA